MHFNPDKRVILYTSNNSCLSSKVSYTTSEHTIPLHYVLGFDILRQISNLEIIEIDIQQEFNINSEIFHTFIADLIRIKKLEEHGGFWFDMDILFLKKIPTDLESLSGKSECIVTSYSGTIATGFVGGVPHAAVFKDLLAAALQEKDNLCFRANYQVFGPDLWKKIAIPRIKDTTVTLFNRRLIYPYLWNEMSFYFEYDSYKMSTHDYFGVHWYNGSNVAHTYLNLHPDIEAAASGNKRISKDLKYLLKELPNSLYKKKEG